MALKKFSNLKLTNAYCLMKAVSKKIVATIKCESDVSSNKRRNVKAFIAFKIKANNEFRVMSFFSCFVFILKVK